MHHTWDIDQHQPYISHLICSNTNQRNHASPPIALDARPLHLRDTNTSIRYHPTGYINNAPLRLLRRVLRRSLQ
jgi:hypothetical protein